MTAILPGFLTGLSLIVAIGAQNAFVLRQGLLRKHVLPIVLICAISDATLIILGVLGLGALISALPWLLEVIRWVGVAFLVWYGSTSLKRFMKNESLKAAEAGSGNLKQTVLTTLALTFLNPHVYLDTVIFIGGIANQFGDQKWMFVIGAVTASFIWFFGLGFGASKASVVMSRPTFWKILDVFIAAVMFSLAITLAVAKLS
ncbi:MAG: LysE/ArgO family amino acid transporter [Rhodoluna sp.]|nr:LysE/ArgO family amino acid transporter [Rhodoluna sp.]